MGSRRGAGGTRRRGTLRHGAARGRDRGTGPATPPNAVAVVDEALAVVERAEREPREEREERGTTAMASVLLERRAWYLLRQGANDAARKAYDAALAALPETADAATRARVLVEACAVWERSAEYDRALTLAQEAVDVAVAGWSRRRSARPSTCSGVVLLARGDVDARSWSSSARRPPPKRSSTRCCSRSRVRRARRCLRAPGRLARRGARGAGVGGTTASAR